MVSAATCLFLVAAVSVTVEATPYWREGSDGRRYFIDNDQQYNWFQAQHKCERLNMQLMEIQSALENEVILEILRSSFETPLNFWLGANDEYNQTKDFNRPFFWSLSSKRMNFSYWSKNNPNNFKNREHCVHMWDKADDYKWNDIECTTKMGYICEDNHVDVEKCEKLQEKRQRIANITSDMESSQRLRQDQQSEILNNVYPSIEEIDKKFADSLLEAQTKLQADIQKLLIQNRNNTLAALEGRNKEVQQSHMEVKTSVGRSNAEFSDKLQIFGKSIQDILEC